MGQPNIARTASRYALTLVLICITFFLGFKIAGSLPKSAVLSGGSYNPTAADLRKLLDGMASEGELRRGAQVELVEFRKNDGQLLSISAVEGEFDNSSIEPQQTWASILSEPTLLISSGDEELRNDGGVSLRIGIGCNIVKSSITLATGDISRSDCNGSYRKLFPHLLGVRSTIMKAWKGVDEKEDCEPKSVTEKEGSQSEYAKCVRDAIQQSLTALFEYEDLGYINTIVLPALGTGTAGIAKGISYSTALDTVEICLTKHGCYEHLPRQIVLAIWKGDVDKDGHEMWPATRDAIARNLAAAAEKWGRDYTPKQSPVKPARYLCITIVLLIVSLLVTLQNKLPIAVGARVPSLQSRLLWLVIVGWGVAAAGAVSIFSDILDSFTLRDAPVTTAGVLLNIGLGMVAAASCGLIKKAGDAFEHQQVP